MNAKHRKTLAEIFENPVRADIAWKDVVALLTAMGAHVRQGQGSRLRVTLGTVRMTFHEPHPEKTTDKGAVKTVRLFLEKAGAKL
ncbi:MAG: type II toxin-antitoxin system HicA family toxin [Desulfovibrionaceae bacterium]|nr:type II toxin-antitoxin system HicA family toxin [Desulfovibrionaceae bacterium]MBF0514219.1 type II toxin-antitoxin system HicA family toxin [Desulfovibrionaceae bacterium]